MTAILAALWVTLKLATLTTVILLLLGTPLAWWLAIPVGRGLNGIVWAVIAASFLSAGLLLTRLWALSRQEL